jgi:hypothetical protein
MFISLGSSSLSFSSSPFSRSSSTLAIDLACTMLTLFALIMWWRVQLFKRDAESGQRGFVVCVDGGRWDGGRGGEGVPDGDGGGGEVDGGVLELVGMSGSAKDR